MHDARSVTVARLRARLADTRLPDDPARARLPADAAQWPDDVRREFDAVLKPAGVLIPIIEHAPHLTVLLTRRSAQLKHHASQVAFPGGRMEESDRDIRATALRETHEEIGIAPPDVAVLGCLDPLPTMTGYAVTPIVGVISPQQDIRIDRSEVDVAFEVPLEFLFDEANAHRRVHTFRGHRIPTVEFHFAGHRIWGATASMLIRLRELTR